LLACSASSDSKPDISCLENAVRKDRLAGIDFDHNRLFLVESRIDLTELKEQIKALNACLHGQASENDWAISIFSEAKYAGYKDDPRILPFHKNNEWAKAYIGEYQVRTKTLILDPALKSRKQVLDY
jgi:hypothetical protein